MNIAITVLMVLVFLAGIGTGLFALFFICLATHWHDIFRKYPKKPRP